MKDEERNQLWFSPEMLETMRRKIWMAAWCACAASGGTVDEMKSAYENWKLTKWREGYAEETL